MTVPTLVPARNQTLPDWCAPQSAGPPARKNGTSAAGKENAHCHHIAPHMPAFRGRISERDMDDLVAFVMATAGMPEPADSLSRGPIPVR